MNELLRDVKAAYEGLQALNIRPTKNNLMILNFTLDTLQKVAEVFAGILKNESKAEEDSKADGQEAE